LIYENFLAQFTDWRPETLYWQRFSVAERFGKDEITRVYNEIFNEAKSDYKHLTELVMILNHKTWEHCEHVVNPTFCGLYKELYYATDEYAKSHLTGKWLSYYYDVTD
jgi:hypothetical protein